MPADTAQDTASGAAESPALGGTTSPTIQDQPQAVMEVPVDDTEAKTDQQKSEDEGQEPLIPPPSARDCLELTENILSLLRKLRPLEKHVLPQYLIPQMRDIHFNALNLEEYLRKSLQNKDHSDSGNDSVSSNDRQVRIPSVLLGLLQSAKSNPKPVSRLTSITHSTSSVVSRRPPPPELVGRDINPCRVHRATMEEWKRTSPMLSTRHRLSPMIEAFYHRLHTTNLAPSMSTDLPDSPSQPRVSTQAPSGSKNLQRVLIWSSVIHIELEKLFSGAQFVPLPVA